MPPSLPDPYGLFPDADATLAASAPAAPPPEGVTLGAALAAPPPEADPPPGYLILGVLGRGGMGVVYEARQVALDRVVALKMLLGGGHASADDLARFRLEAQALARLAHPHIVQVFEVGEHHGRPFFSMELCGGGGLDKRLAGSPLPPDEAAALVEALARAVQAAHEAGVVHRDLKPANVLLSEPRPSGSGLAPPLPDGRGSAVVAKITDFGLARKLDDAGHTRTGAILGTPSYMAPEQAEGKKDVGTAADVYGLGAILYECLTGRPPFKAATPVDTILQVIDRDPIPPRQLNPQVPRDLETVCLTCLAKEPGRRYGDAATLAAELARFRAGQPVLARPVGRLERAWRWCRRYPAVASLLAAVIGLLSLVAVGSLVMAARFDAQRRHADEARETAVRAERQGRLREAEALIGEAHGIRHSRRPGQRFAALAALRKAAAIGRELEQPADWFDRLRNEAIAALALPDLFLTETAGRLPFGTHMADVSADFELYVRTGPRGDVSVRCLRDDTEVARRPEVGEKVLATFGPGRWLAVVGETSRALQIWNVAGPQPVLRLEASSVSTFHFSPDASRLAIAHLNGAISAYDVASRQRTAHLPPGKVTRFANVYLHPTGPFVLVTSYFQPLFEVRDLRTGRQVAEIDPPWPGGMGAATWAPDGRTLAVPCGDGGPVQLCAFDPAGPALRPARVLDVPRAEAGLGLTFNPAGDRLAARGWSGSVHLLDVPTGRLRFSTHSLQQPGSGLRFDPAGGRLAAARVGEGNDRLGLWSVADGREYRVLVSRRGGQGTDHHPPAVHPNGRLLAQSFTNGVALFDLDTGAEVAFLPIPQAGRRWGCWASFDGNGALLTNAFSGCLRWPVRPDPSRAGGWTVGPPEPLPFFPGNHSIAASRDGKVVAQSMWSGYGMSRHAGGWILHPNLPLPRRVERGVGVGPGSVSPDGRWVTFNNKVFEAATAREVWRAAEGGLFRFSPDGRWLVTNADGGRAYAVGTWQPGPLLGPGTPTDVSADGGLVVMALTSGVYRLVELPTGRELARLDDPDQSHGPAVFTPDGTRLVAVARESVRVWDLRRLRGGLRELDLDWDAPAYPAPRAGSGPLEVRLVGAELADTRQMAEYRRRKAIADLFFNPFDADAHVRLSGFLLSAGNATAAANHLGFALALRPGMAEAHYLRARAALRLGRWPDATAEATGYLNHDPEDASTRLLRAEALRLAKRHDEAIRDYTALIERYPRDPQLYQQRALCHDALGRADRARADRTAALQFDPTDPTARNNLAWRLVTDTTLKSDPVRALRLITAAIAEQPNNPTFLNTLGVVQYRNQLYAEARATLEKSLALGKGRSDGFDLFFLAMCHAHLGDAGRAKECFDRAVKWTDEQKELSPPHVSELKRFRAEAEQTLARLQKKPPAQ